MLVPELVASTQPIAAELQKPFTNAPARVPPARTEIMLGGDVDLEAFDKPSQVASYLSGCAQRFLNPSTPSGRPQVLPALKCLYTCLTMVLPAQLEAEIRLQLGNALLDHTKNSQEALIQLQKAHHLAISVNQP